MVEWEDGEVTTWSEVTYESGLVIPKDQLEGSVDQLFLRVWIDATSIR